MELSTQIKEARRKLALTQEQAAQRWDVPLKTLRHWEQGRHSPRGFALRMLRQVLDAALAEDKTTPVAPEPPAAQRTGLAAVRTRRTAKSAKPKG